MPTWLIKTFLLWIVWIALSGSHSLGNLVLGAVVAGVIVLLTPAQDSAQAALPTWSLTGALLYLPWLLWRIVDSSVHLACLVLHPRLPIDPTVVRYAPSLQDPRAIVIMGNSITLTPGTITIEATPEELVVHAIDARSASDVVSGRLEEKIQTIFASQD
ncbi:MAG: ABC transporter permease [Nitrospirae bacterium]|nr:MAG: ABC transporter permease [Nitrospirota bacterium]